MVLLARTTKRNQAFSVVLSGWMRIDDSAGAHLTVDSNKFRYKEPKDYCDA